MKKRMKNPAAVALGKLAAGKLSKAERAQLASLGGKARAKKLSKAERSRIARKAAAAREARRK